MFFCPLCNRENEDWYSFCQYCGTRLDSPAPDTGRRKLEEKGSIPVAPSPPPISKVKAESISMKAREGPRSPVFAETTPLLSVPPIEDTPPAVDASVPPKRITREPTAPRTPIGKVPEAPRKVCDNCGLELSDTSAFCSHCGHVCLAVDSASRGSMVEGIAKKEVIAKKDLRKQPVSLIHFQEGDHTDFGFTLRIGETVIGRYNGDILFPSDNMLSKRHLRIFHEACQIQLEDLSSTNGTYLRIKRPTPLQNGDMIRIGKQILRFDLPGAESAGEDTEQDRGDETMGQGCADVIEQPRLVKRLSRGQDGAEFLLTENSTVIGRDDGDIVFPNDPVLSTPHARIVRRNSFFLLEDMNSSKGTYLRLRTPVQVEAEDYFMIGDQLFQLRVKLL